MPERNVNVREPRKILILRFSSLGDVVMATPLVRVVRKTFPFAQIDMIVRQDFIDLIQHNPHLDRKIGLSRDAGFKGLWKLRRDINREHYDLIYDAHRSLRTLFLMPALQAEAKAYFDKHYLRRDLALTFKLPLLRGMPRTLERYIEPLHPWGVNFDNKGPEVFIDEKAWVSAKTKVTLPTPLSGGHRIGVIPSAQWPGKRWPLDRFRGVMKRILAQTPHALLVFGGQQDSFCQDLCLDLPPERVTNAQGKLSLAESTALLKDCHFVIANDTGLMHVADALDIPSILILGPTSKELGCIPFHPWREVLEHDLWCRPCSKNGQAPCIRAKRYCLEYTTEEMVFKAVGRISARIASAS